VASSKRIDNSWVKKLESIQHTRGIRPEGQGWKSTNQLKEIYKCGTCRMYDIINKGVESGEIEIFNGSSENPSGRLVRRVWYRLANM